MIDLVLNLTSPKICQPAHSRAWCLCGYRLPVPKKSGSRRPTVTSSTSGHGHVHRTGALVVQIDAEGHGGLPRELESIGVIHIGLPGLGFVHGLMFFQMPELRV